jgi:hypothetical protein
LWTAWIRFEIAFVPPPVVQVRLASVSPDA